MTANVWSPGDVTDISTANADNTIKSQRFVALAGQSIFNLTSFAYAPNSGSLSVVVNGAMQFPIVDFTETSASSFTVPGLEEGDVVAAFGMVGSPAAQSASVAAAASAGSATTAAASATAANTSAGNALTSANAAAQAVTDANIALNAKVTAANTSASNAAGSATAAATSAQAASDSAVAAAASAAGNAQIQSDWTQATTTAKDYIKNKPTIITTVLTGYAIGVNAILAATDTIVGAFGKLQKQLTDMSSSVSARVQLGASNLSTGTTLTSGLPPSIATITSTSNDLNVPLIVGNNSVNTASAVMQFARNGIFACFFGLDTDNKLKVGGSSMGAAAYEIYHQGNLSPMPTGGGNFSGSPVLNNGVSISARDTGGTSRFLVNLANDNNVYHTVAGGLYIRWYNQAFNTELANLSNTGVYSAVVVTQTSDERKKINWQRAAPDFVAKLAAVQKVGTFNWKADGELSCGIGAQSLEEFLPSAIYEGPDGIKRVNTGGAAMVMCAELAVAVVALQAEIKQLKGI